VVAIIVSEIEKQGEKKENKLAVGKVRTEQGKKHKKVSRGKQKQVKKRRKEKQKAKKITRV
jgi:hypothetical protein